MSRNSNPEKTDPAKSGKRRVYLYVADGDRGRQVTSVFTDGRSMGDACPLQKSSEKVTFDWDRDYDDLVYGAGAAKVVVESPRSADQLINADSPPASLRAVFARWVAPALLIAGLAVGVAFPEKFGFGEHPVQTANMFVAFPSEPVAPVASVALQAYSDAQRRNFVLGLQRFSDADLLAYDRVTQIDLDRAGPMMRPLLRDALTLTQIEIERRNLVPPRVVRSVQEVLIQVPLQG